MYLIRAIAKSNCMTSHRSTNSNKRYKQCAAIDIEYRSLIFSFIDNVKPEPESPKGKNITPAKKNDYDESRFCSDMATD
jgi:hypothetical protein